VRRISPWRCFLAGAGLLVAGAACGQQETVAAWNGEAETGRHLGRLSFSAVVPPVGTALPGSVDVGVQWRQPLLRQQMVDISAWHRIQPPSDALGLVQQREPVFGARIEMKLTSPSLKNYFADRFIGMQLDSGARIGIKKSNGNPTIYYRNQF